MAGKRKKESGLTLEERLKRALVPEEEQPYHVPENWVWTYIGTVANLHRGVTYKKEDAHFDKSANDCLILRGGNILEGAIDLEADSIYVDKKLVDEAQYIKSFDIVVVSSTGSTKVIGRAGISYADYADVAFGAFLTLVRPKEMVNKAYIAHFFQSDIYRNRIQILACGVNINNIRGEYITSTQFPIPPLSEQQRIVDRIESLFAKLDAAKEKAQAAVDSFETRKAALLHKAFLGDLTKQWRKKNEIDLSSWDSGVLLDYLIDKPRNGYSPTPVSYPTTVKSMTLSATTTGIFLPQHFKYIDEKISDNSYLWLVPGDILIQRANSFDKVGTSALYTGGVKEFIYPDLIMKLQTNQKAIPQYIAYLLKTDITMQYLRSHATGTAGNMPKIKQVVVSSIPVRVATIPEQKEIVRILDDLLAKEQKAKEEAAAVLERIDLIKKSILARAFRGELGTNDPSEESAVELLKQCLAEGEVVS